MLKGTVNEKIYLNSQDKIKKIRLILAARKDNWNVRCNKLKKMGNKHDMNIDRNSTENNSREEETVKGSHTNISLDMNKLILKI